MNNYYLFNDSQTRNNEQLIIIMIYLVQQPLLIASQNYFYSYSTTSRLASTCKRDSTLARQYVVTLFSIFTHVTSQILYQLEKNDHCFFIGWRRSGADVYSSVESCRCFVVPPLFMQLLQQLKLLFQVQHHYSERISQHSNQDG